MPDRFFNMITGLSAGTMGYLIGMSLLQTASIVIITNLVHAFLVAWFEWDSD